MGLILSLPYLRCVAAKVVKTILEQPINFAEWHEPRAFRHVEGATKNGKHRLRE